MTITVVGHLCLDVIHHPPQSNGQQRETRSYGGIFFTVATLANVVEPGTTIYPVFGVGKNEFAEFMERLRAYPKVDPSGIYKFDAPTNEVHLYYRNEQQRTECSKHIAEPVSFKRIKPYLAADMVLINMVSGFDITLDTLDEVRMSVREQHVPLYLDVHSLSLGINDDFTRVRRPLTDWRRWLFWLHAVQMNEEEAAGLSVEPYNEEYLAKQATALNLPVLIITRGARGCTAYIDERNHLARHDVAGVALEGPLDATGCGDVFGAAYCAQYLASRDVRRSVEFANTVAAFNAAIAGSTETDRLAKFTIRRRAVPSGVTP